MTTERRRLIRIAIAIALMVAAVWVAGEMLYQVTTGGAPVVTTDAEPEVIDLQQGQFAVQLGEQSPASAIDWGTGSRTLEQLYERRAYHGAPPHIPHPVVPDMQREESCLSCHRHGGYTPKFDAFAPVTPHPQLVACQQCHVTSDEKGLFRENLFEQSARPRLDQVAMPGAPHPMPHGLQMRENCVACHAGPAAPPELRTDHPNRPGCLQCHALPSDAEQWVRNEESGS